MFVIKDIPGKGRGLVACENIPKCQIITYGPYMEVPRNSLKRGPLKNHYWSYAGKDYITFGAQTLCNHDDNPNCFSDVDDRIDYLVSKRDIKDGEELTLDYREWED